MRSVKIMLIIHYGIFEFDPKDPIFRDHFPGHPIVPGTLIIAAFLKVLQKCGQCGQTVTLSNFRFIKWVTPGTYRYRIFQRSEHASKIECELLANDTVLVRGSILR
ncbi:MAG: hypothetical protein WA081_00445 [Desulfosalsimonadaceae bacterium]